MVNLKASFPISDRQALDEFVSISNEKVKWYVNFYTCVIEIII